MALRKKLEPGEYLFHEGESPGAMYVLLAGELAVEARGERLAVIDHVGAFVGELSFLTGNPRSADVRAVSESKVLVVNDIDSFFKDDPAHAVAVARELARRLDMMDRKFLQMKQLADSAQVGEGTVADVVRLLTGDGAAGGPGLT